MKMLYDWGWRSRNYISVSIDLLERQEDKHWFLIVDKEADRALAGDTVMYLCGDYIWTVSYQHTWSSKQSEEGQTEDALDRVCV